MRILIIPDPHAHPKHDNTRATNLSKLMMDIQFDVVINLGDMADMSSLCTYDKGTKGFEGRRYKDDINAALDFDTRLWEGHRKTKKKLPRRVFCVGNHEQRINKAISSDPVLEGTIGLKDLDLERNYDDIVYYDGGTPGQINIGGIEFGHYVVSGLLGRPLSTEHMGYSLLAKKHESVVVGHSHIIDYSARVKGNGKFIHGLSAGCFIDYKTDWAGKIEDQWWRGVCILSNVEDGNYDLSMVSIDKIDKQHGKLYAA